MWSAILSFFINKQVIFLYPKNKSCTDKAVANIVVNVFNTMDRITIDERRKEYEVTSDQHFTSGDFEYLSDSYHCRQAKQRASVKWLLSKAYNNRVPEKLREPYYRDHEDQEHLKPHIVHALSNAELYCLALANIYSDPNYHNQSHTGILQALARKGVFVAEPNSSHLTETILIQNSPLKMSAHMAVIEGLMVLYAKEVVSGERVIAAIQRFDPQPQQIDAPLEHEQGLLLWISYASSALVAKIQAEEISGEKARLTDLPATKDLQSLCDGVGLAAVVAYYCPSELNWMDIKVSKRPSVADAHHNLALVHAFCLRCLPYPIFHMQLQDITYMRGSMKQNLVVFLAEMYNVLEIHPVKCVRYPGEEKAQQYLDACPRNSYGVAHKRILPQSVTPIPDLRSNLCVSAPGFTVTKNTVQNTVKKSQSMQQTSESYLSDERKKINEEPSIELRVKGMSTLNSVGDDKTFIRAEAAGRPSNWEDQRRSSYAGRRSRRNSITTAEDSQLTIENFGGSQDNLHNIGRNPDKVVGKHVLRNPRLVAEPAQPVRSSIQDAYSSGVHHIIADNGHTNDNITSPPSRLRRQKSNPNLSHHVSLKNILLSTENDIADDDAIASLANTAATMASFANLNKNSEKAINLMYTEQEKDEKQSNQSLTTTNINRKHGQSNGNGFIEKKATFATLPNMTTWQQQSNQQNQQIEHHSTDENNGSAVMASQLNNIKLKLEERKRHIENEKRRMEIVMSKRRQKVGKAAFLQAITKGKVKSPSSSTSGGDSPVEMDPAIPINSVQTGNSSIIDECSCSSIVSTQQLYQEKQRPFSLKEIDEDVRDVEHKWLDQESAPFVETRLTPDIENMDIDQYHQSITKMNSSLSEIQQDIQRLANQQNQMQQQHLMTQHQQQLQQLQQLQSHSHQNLHTYSTSPQNQIVSRVHESPQSQFYLHDQPQVPRRTWGQPQPIQLGNEISSVGYNQSMDSRYVSPSVYQQDPRVYQETRSWGISVPQQKGFILHETSQEQRYLNGSEHCLSSNQHHMSSYPVAQSLFSQTPPSSTSPQHRNAVHRISQLMNDSPDIKRQNIHHIPLSCGSPLDKKLNSMPPEESNSQNMSYLVNEEDFAHGIRNLNITSGNRTYRIPSPTRPSISRNSFQPHISLRETTPLPSANTVEVVPSDTSDIGEKGFYISFDDAPKKPKPSLRTKKTSPKKERSVSAYLNNNYSSRYESPSVCTILDRKYQIEVQKDIEKDKRRKLEEQEQHRKELMDRDLQKDMSRKQQRERQKSEGTDGRQANSVGLVIGNQLLNLDPNSIDEMERKKEKIMLLSLQRRQQQEELKERKEAEAQARREEEKIKVEERTKKKEEEKQRRAAILEQYKLKKAIEEAEREGKVIDKDLLNALKPTKLRNKATPSRPRPKTIHVDAGTELDSGVLTPSRGKKGSSSNLSTASLTSPTMRRDYYRGSQDSLTTAHLDDRRSNSLYRGGSLRVSSIDSPDDGRGSSPSRSGHQLGRRSSYKTSRDVQEPQQQVRGRPKYPSYQNFKGRKSSSLMNLCDTDSGLGRATPPRRAPSPGMVSMRHLPSPSGPGSLPPGLMTKRRVYDDGSSDISSTPSSMMDYNGPRLYKQPATKSNRGIMLNAVEYCVFPGTVNKEAKRRVLDEISRSESKHFLILFRDAGCQFRALYSYCPDREEVSKLYGTGPKQVIDKMFDKFFKYNSGGKCFSQVHTKHLTVTIDAFTIHNSLWQGKKVNLPNKKDMALVI